MPLLYISKMFNLDNITNENNKEHNKKWPYVPDHPYRILIIGGSASRKTNVLLNLISQQDGIDKIYLYGKDLSGPKYKFLIKIREDTGIKHLNDSNAFIDCSNTIDEIYEILMNITQKEKKKIVSDDMIAGIMSNEKCQAVV